MDGDLQQRFERQVEFLLQSQAKHDAQIGAMTDKISALLEAVRQDGENIRGLARIAEIHERLSRLEEEP